MVKKTLKEMLDRRNAVNADLKSLEDKRVAEKRDFLQEEAERIDGLLNERGQLDTDIKLAEVSEQRQQRLRSVLSPETPAGDSRSPIVRGVEPNLDERRDPVVNPDSSRYSLLRAISRRAAGLPLDGYEGEISQEIARRSGKEPQGFFMPMSLRVEEPGQERRDVDTTAGAGAIPRTLLTGRFIDALRNRAMLMALGAQMMSDMVGIFDIPKQTGVGQAYWVNEAGSPTESGQTIGQVSFTPSTLGAFTDITRRLLKQTSLDAEMLVRNDLTKVIALELDRAGINGSGSGAEPQGILQNSSVATVAMGTNGLAPTWAKIVELESTIAAANADAGTMAYLTSCVGRGKMKTTEKGSAGYPVYLWGDDSRVNGYRAAATNQIPSNLTKGSGTNLTAMIFGDFSTLMYAFWGGLDILVDPYTQSTSGGVRIVALIDATLKILQTEKLAKIVDLIRV